jgi:hypothetical protein
MSADLWNTTGARGGPFESYRFITMLGCPPEKNAGNMDTAELALPSIGSPRSCSVVFSSE